MIKNYNVQIKSLRVTYFKEELNIKRKGSKNKKEKVTVQSLLLEKKNINQHLSIKKSFNIEMCTLFISLQSRHNFRYFPFFSDAKVLIFARPKW